MNWHCFLLMNHPPPHLPASLPPSPAFPSVIFLTPPKDDMEIHVSASLTMRSHKAIKKEKKRKTETSECLSLSCLLIDDKENDWEVLDRGAWGNRQREFYLLSQIFRKETWAGILASHFSYCITLIKGLPGRSCEPSVTVMFWKQRGGKKKNTTKRSILQRCLFPDSGINCLVLNDHGHCITWKLTARIYVSASLLASWVAETNNWIGTST